jgi:hypothetical protein
LNRCGICDKESLDCPCYNCLLAYWTKNNPDTKKTKTNAYQEALKEQDKLLKAKGLLPGKLKKGYSYKIREYAQSVGKDE